MAKVFLRKIWSFNPGKWPVLGFAQEPMRRKFLAESAPEDWLYLAGTHYYPTLDAIQGRIVGRVKVGRTEVDTLALLNQTGHALSKHDLNADGSHKMPFGLPILQAEKCVGFPVLTDVLGSHLSGYDWVKEARDVDQCLDENSSTKLTALETKPIQTLPIPGSFLKQAIHQEKGSLVSGNGQGGGYVYLLTLSCQKNIFKVGFCANLGHRLDLLNTALLSPITNLKWEILQAQPIDNRESAYRIESNIHRRLRPYLYYKQEVYQGNRKEVENIFLKELALSLQKTRRLDKGLATP